MAEVNYEDAINDLVFLQKRFKGLMEVIPELQKFSSLGNAIREREERVSQLDGILAAVKEDITSGKKEFEALVADNQASVASAVKEGQEVLKKAKDKASEILLAAEAKADKLVSEAHQRAADIDQKIEAGLKELAEVTDAVSAQKKSYQDIQLSIAELKSRL